MTSHYVTHVSSDVTSSSVAWISNRQNLHSHLSFGKIFSLEPSYIPQSFFAIMKCGNLSIILRFSCLFKIIMHDVACSDLHFLTVWMENKFVCLPFVQRFCCVNRITSKATTCLCWIMKFQVGILNNLIVTCIAGWWKNWGKWKVVTLISFKSFLS